MVHLENRLGTVRATSHGLHNPFFHGKDHLLRISVDSSVVERLVYTELVGGSNPSPRTSHQPVVRRPEAMALIEISMSGSIASAEA